MPDTHHRTGAKIRHLSFRTGSHPCPMCGLLYWRMISPSAARVRIALLQLAKARPRASVRVVIAWRRGRPVGSRVSFDRASRRREQPLFHGSFAAVVSTAPIGSGGNRHHLDCAIGTYLSFLYFVDWTQYSIDDEQMHVLAIRCLCWAWWRCW